MEKKRKYIVELKKKQRLANVKQSIYLKWAKDGIVHIVLDKNEATRYTKEQVEKLKKVIDEERMILHEEVKKNVKSNSSSRKIERKNSVNRKRIW